jgi:hypothetical protein
MYARFHPKLPNNRLTLAGAQKHQLYFGLECVGEACGRKVLLEARRITVSANPQQTTIERLVRNFKCLACGHKEPRLSIYRLYEPQKTQILLRNDEVFKYDDLNSESRLTSSTEESEQEKSMRYDEEEAGGESQFWSGQESHYGGDDDDRPLRVGDIDDWDADDWEVQLDMPQFYYENED